MFQPVLPAQVSSSQNLLEPPLIIGKLLLEPLLIVGELLLKPPLFIGPSWVTTHHWIYWTTNHQSYSPIVLQCHIMDPSASSIWSICLLHYRTFDRHTADYLVTVEPCKIHLCALIFANERSLKLWNFSLKCICKYHCLLFFWLKQLYLLYFNSFQSRLFCYMSLVSGWLVSLWRYSNMYSVQ